MSGGKSGNGVPHQVIDRMVRFENLMSGKHADVVKVVKEVVEKHNELAAGQAALQQMISQVSGFVAAEMGKFQGTTTQHIGILGRSLEGLDLNVLALAEMSKELIGQLTQVDTLFKKLHETVGKVITSGGGNEAMAEFTNALELSETEVATIKAEATEWYSNLVKSSFKTVQEKRAAAEQAHAEQEAKEKAEAEAAAAKLEAEEKSKTEKDTVEAELKAASEAERSVVTTKSGGPGSAFPADADIFGG